MGFLANLLTKAFIDPRVRDLSEKIDNAETDEEREGYESELQELDPMSHYDWW